MAHPAGTAPGRFDAASKSPYICGVKGMEKGVYDAFRDACRQRGKDWCALVETLGREGRYHVETY
mgnify:CR=1 FL=1